MSNKSDQKHIYSGSFDSIQEPEYYLEGVVRNYIILFKNDEVKQEGKIQGYEFPAKSKDAAIRSALFWFNFEYHEKIKVIKEQQKHVYKPNKYASNEEKHSYGAEMRHKKKRIIELQERMRTIEDGILKVIEVQELSPPLGFNRVLGGIDKKRHIFANYSVNRPSKKGGSR